MKRLAAIAAIAVLTTGLAGCKTAEQAAQEAGKQPLSAQEMSTIADGNTFAARNVSGQEWFEYHAGDGTLYAGAGKSGGSSWLREGEWWVNDAGEYCLTMPGWSNATNRCQPVYRTDDGYEAYWQDGRRYMTFQVLDGDPEDLDPRN